MLKNANPMYTWYVQTLKLPANQKNKQFISYTENEIQNYFIILIT